MKTNKNYVNAMTKALSQKALNIREKDWVMFSVEHMLASEVNENCFKQFNT